MRSLVPSISQSITSGSELVWAPWVPYAGPTGRRNVILGFLLYVSYQIDVTTAALLGADACRWFFGINISDIAGPRWRLSGMASRKMSMLLMGPQRTAEAADVAAGSNKTGTHTMYIPLAKPFSRRPYDYAIPGDSAGEIRLMCPSAAQLSVGTSVVAIDSASYQIVAVCREENDVEVKSRDVVTSTVQRSPTQGTIAVGGGYLAEVIAHLPDGTTGGGAVDGWTKHHLGIPISSPPILQSQYQALYAVDRAMADNLAATTGSAVYGDPILDGEAAIVHLPASDSKLVDLPYIDQDITVESDNDDDNVELIHRVVVPKSLKSAQAAAAYWGVDASRGTVATAAGDMTSPSEWGRVAQYLPSRLGTAARRR